MNNKPLGWALNPTKENHSTTLSCKIEHNTHTWHNDRWYRWKDEMNCFWHSEPRCHLDPLVFQCVDQALDNMESSSRLQLMGKTSNNTQFKYCLMPCDTTLLGVRETTIYTVSFNINSIHAYYIPCSTFLVQHRVK